MNRQTKRAMARQEKTKGGAGGGAGGPGKTAPGGRKPAVPPPGAKKKRTGMRQFLKEVRIELKKVQWPTRQEVFAYTLVVLVTVLVVTSFVFVLDYGFSKAALKLFGNG